ncbi:ATP-binding cassette domain-containing protein [Vibrio alginolyticus]
MSLSIEGRADLGLVGESGCGKSSLGRSVARLQSSDGGRSVWRGRHHPGSEGTRLRALRRRVQFVFQDPYASLNPRSRCGRPSPNRSWSRAAPWGPRPPRRRTARAGRAWIAYAHRFPH